MKRILFLATAFLSFNLGFGQVTTIDFETAGDGYTPSTTIGSGFTDVFNRSSPNIGGNSTFLWAVEDISGDPSLTLDQIDVTGGTDFTFSIDMVATHFEDWDSGDELLITYSIDNGSFQNLLWVQMVPGDNFNGPAALDLSFDGDGDCGFGTTLPALTTGTQHGCTVSSSNFETFSSSTITLSSNSTLDIILQFNGLTSADEGIYLDNIEIDVTQSVATCNITSLNLANIQCADNGTNANTSDDVISFDLDPAGSNLGTNYNLTVSSGTVSPTTAAYGSATTFTMQAGSAGGGDFTVTITDDTDGTCTANTTVTDPGPCSVAPCAEPSQATSLVLNNETASSIDVTFTDSGADNYLVVQSTSSTLSLDPSDGNSYAVSDPLGGGTVVFNGSGNSFTDNGLTPSTTYYYFIFANNDASCSGGPNYNLNDLNGNSATLAGPTCFAVQDFDGTNSWTYTSSPSENNATCESNGDVWNVVSSLGSLTIPNSAGNFWGVQDLDGATGCGTSGVGTLDFGTITVSSYSNVTVSFDYEVDGFNASTDEFSYIVTVDGNPQSEVFLCDGCDQQDLEGTETINIPNGSVTVSLQIRYQVNGGSDYSGVDNFAICGVSANEPEIEVQGNSIEIVSGGISPSISDDTDFGQVQTAGTNSVTNTFTILNTGTDDLVITNITSDDANFTIGGTTNTTILAGDSSSFTVTFDPSVLGLDSAIVTIDNDDADENPYTFLVEGEGVNSNSSDIVEDAFTYDSNIEYINFQEVGPFTNASDNVGVFKFDIRDGGASDDIDIESTELNAITFSLGTTHIQYIRNAALFDGLSPVAASPTINTGAGTITFSGLSGANFTALDDSTKSLTLRVSFLTNVTDNEQLQFTITSATANSNGSVFADADAGGAVSSIVGDRNRLEVTADRLSFTQQPTNSSTNVIMLPAVEVSAVDTFQNIDLDFSNSIEITSSGTLSGSPLSETASSGVATFSNVVHTAPGTGLALTASNPTVNNAVSTLFDIDDFVFATGDFRPQFATDFSFNGTWEYFNGSAWITSSGSGWDGNAPQNTTATINRILIDEEVTGGGNTTNNYDCDILILSGGILTVNDNDIPPVAAEFLSAGNTLEVQNGGELIIQGDIDLASSTNLIVRDGGLMTINHDNMTNDHPIWDGIENFEANSTVEIRDWDWGASPTVRSLINVVSTITSNDNGYKFGNVYFNPTNLTDNWTIVGGPVNVNVTEGDFEINNASSFFVLGMSNSASGISSTYGGDILVTDGDFTFGGSFSNNTFDQDIFVNGNVTINSDDDFYIHHTFNNTPTINSGNSPVRIRGNLIVGSSVASMTSDVTTKEIIFDGDNSHTIQITPNISNSPLIIENGDSATLLNENLKFTGSSSLEIEDGATFNFGFDNIGTTALEVQNISGGSNEFLQRGGATLFITHPQGIWDASPNGNVQDFSASNTTYAQSNSTYHYIGKENQETGDAFTSGSTSKTIIAELETNSLELSVTSSTGTSELLEIRRGIVVNTELGNINGSGDLTIVDGGLRTSVLESTSIVPALDGTYTLTGGFVELNATGNQTLRGSRDYFDLIISGANVDGVNDKNVTSAFTIANQLTITGTPIFDIENNGMTGAAGITQDGGFLRMSSLNTSLPELDGTATAYNITGGTIELYGTDTTQTHNLRGTDGNASTISYNNIELNANAANLNPGEFNVGLSAGIILNGTLNINSPTVFQTDELDHIDGTGVFNLSAGATYKYGDPFGITLGSSTAPSAGAIRLSTARVASNFPNTASYGFVGSGDMVTGDALPTQMVNMYLDKSSAGDKVTLSNNANITNTLNFLSSGVIETNAFTLEIENSLNSSIINAASSGSDRYVEGRLQWVTDGTSNYTFPIGHSTQGVQPFDINLTGSNNSTILGFLETNSTNPILPVAYCDVETSTSAGQQIGEGVAGQDGVVDQIEFNIESPLQWNVTNPSGGITEYDLTVLANGGQDINPVTSASGTEIRYLLKNGEPGNTNVSTSNGAPSFNQNGFDECPTGYSLTGLTSFSGFTLNGANASSTTLPVELLYLEANPINNEYIQLDWATATEIENAGFEVQKSINGYDFETIAWVDGNGNSNEAETYQFNDKEVQQGNTYYYKLKQVDFNGDFELTNIVNARLVENTASEINVYPNPTTGKIQITSNNEIVQVDLFDAAGKEISVNLNINNTIATIGLETVAAGVYIVMVETSNEVKSIKLIKE